MGKPWKHTVTDWPCRVHQKANFSLDLRMISNNFQDARRMPAIPNFPPRAGRDGAPGASVQRHVETATVLDFGLAGLDRIATVTKSRRKTAAIKHPARSHPCLNWMKTFSNCQIMHLREKKVKIVLIFFFLFA